MSAPIQIRRPEVVRNIRELASRRGKSVTDTVDEMVKRELAEDDKHGSATLEARRAAVNEILQRIWSRPKTGVLLTDEDLYDADGLPK
jgi:hypothetical protein